MTGAQLKAWLEDERTAFNAPYCDALLALLAKDDDQQIAMLKQLLAEARSERDALLAKEAARGEVVESCPLCQQLQPTWIQDDGCWYCSDCCREVDHVDQWQRVTSADSDLHTARQRA